MEKSQLEFKKQEEAMEMTYNISANTNNISTLPMIWVEQWHEKQKESRGFDQQL